ncbi:SDR family oxidoreductase [Solemya velum gill symbiont]|uniref:Short-chain dehydrogenase n=1 Tax=Solemya velum gill symbiont TaxID=2340 RepID=A0A0B0H728_SOVGS|nr:SDR family oxidoreductase [Solemya velum gill symbiont]KHF25998.1 short-chain dehydrogenase [Solemya velum gill symbiont]OOY51457.1 short-chain dehydrogenase [Solemya velum gill symbiont]OOY55399.1 short-chain dehydrogenase [Solemya velum gill symbiont]OOY56685.1 short-chain dehydrogenase [Solemya velum gill symbiont]OOY59863.1 short-chain dehydrogenase [Solemya velum gill symbiont]
MSESILITGCSSGIGHHVAHALQTRGYRVFATARNEEDIARLNSEGLETLYLEYADSDSIRSTANHVLEQTDGKLYALFNNGAYGQPGAVEDLSREALTAQFEANFFGWHELTCALLPSMRQQQRGRIIQNSSVLGFAAMAYRGAYNASKFAIEGLTDTLRLELQGSGVHVSLIEPGPIVSKFRDNGYKMFNKYINADKSIHKEAYEGMIRRLTTEGPVAPFTLPPDAVHVKVLHALESKRPKARYYVTKPTWFMGITKRFLSTRQMDRVLMKAGGGGKR